MARWLGIDHGTKRIGVAVGDISGAIATPLAVISAEPIDAAIGRITELAEEYGVEGVVVGWPINMDDSEGPQGKLARAMADTLAEMTDFDVRLWDERLTSFAADNSLAGKLTRQNRKARQDAVAAAAMLHDFLAAGGPETAPRPGEISD